MRWKCINSIVCLLHEGSLRRCFESIWDAACLVLARTSCAFLLPTMKRSVPNSYKDIRVINCCLVVGATQTLIDIEGVFLFLVLL